jgi:two-component system, NarL family, nitrate/nitrite sensor histidine kinase NarX
MVVLTLFLKIPMTPCLSNQKSNNIIEYIGVWSENIIAGDLDSRIEIRDGEHQKLINNINSIAKMLQVQTTKVQKQIRLHSEHTKTISIVQERGKIANELHDSLAQTIASIKLQMRVLDDLLQPISQRQLSMQIEKLENSINEAYNDLRTIIGEFRAPMLAMSFKKELSRIVENFERETNISCYIQNEADKKISGQKQVQLIRIISEALTNIKKYAEAQFVRVLIAKNNKTNRYQLLVEDDGVGFIYKKNKNKKDGFHIGLAIMSDRASQIGAVFQIESSIGEGTRVIVNNIRL